VDRDAIRKGEPGEEVYCKICDTEIGRALVTFGSPGYTTERRDWVHVASGLRHCHPVATPALATDIAPGNAWRWRHHVKRLLAHEKDDGRVWTRG
jgi:hypothetical protein